MVIFDDASTDGTSDIIREYCNKYPQLIHAFIAKENSYINPVRYDLTLEFRKNILRGEYVAFCEGDDCWTDVHKLQIELAKRETELSGVRRSAMRGGSGNY